MRFDRHSTSATARQVRRNLLPATARVAVFMLLSLLIGCEKPSAPPAEPTTRAVGAAPEHYTMEKTGLPVVFPQVPPAPRPTSLLPKDASCVTAECHADFTRAPQIHSPVAQRACDSCHDQDIGGHRYPLKRSANQTCTFCHSVAGSQSHQHKALEQGCLACHQPHVSQAKFLLKYDTVDRTCADCHNVPLKKFAHEPFVRGQCTVCHQPHESDNRMLLRGGEGARHCFTCHDGLKNAMLAATHVHKPVTQDCNTCHEPHSTDHPKQLRTSIEQNCYSCHEQIRKHVESSNVQHAAMTTANTCANCHNPHASQDKDLLRQRMDRTCLSCHDKPLAAADGHSIPNMKPVITGSRFLHGPVRMGDCSGCHDPHGARFPNLLDAAFPKTFYARFDLARYQLCFNCHDSAMVLEPRTTSLTNFRDGDVNLHYVHVNRDDKGRSCKTCHAVHGSNLPNHMASEVPFEGSSWAMPIEFEKRSDGGACAPGCHVPKTYTRSPTTAPATMPMSKMIRGVE